MKKTGIIICFLLIGTLLHAQKYVAIEVKEGTVLQELANELSIDVGLLESLNPGLERREVIPSSQLVVPANKFQGEAKAVQFTLYEVSPKETLYSIARSFEVSIKELKDFNPYLYQRELNESDQLRISVKTLTEKEENQLKNLNKSVTNSSFGKLKHLVEPKETFYSISKKYGVSIASIKEANPDLESLQAGQFVTIIRNENLKEEALEEIKSKGKEELKFVEIGKRNKLKSILEENEVSFERLENLNPSLKYSGFEDGMVLKIPYKRRSLLIPGEKHINLEYYINYPEEKQIKVFLPLSLNLFENDSVNKEVLLKRNRLSRIALDLYTGIQIAKDSALAQGVSSSIQIFDTQADPKHFYELLEENDFSKTQAIIGPVIEANIQEALRYYDLDSIPVFTPLINTPYFKNNLFKTIPDIEEMENSVFSYMSENHNEENVVFFADSALSDLKHKIKYTFIDASEVRINNEYLKKQDLRQVLKKDLDNWFILESLDPGTIEATVSFLTSLQRDGFKIRLFTTNRVQFYENEVPNSRLSNLNFTFPSVSRELAKPAPESFEEKFKAKYGYYPNKFVVRGFDLTYDVLMRLAFKNDIYQTLQLESYTEYFENKFNYWPFDFDEGYYNTSFYLIQQKPDLEVNVIDFE
ncbi:MAG: LysM peptidoglycan-binding domain-containing protein [Flavobacteriaceae bacterium]|nr:LysM peptidoglycan-binding domain-containing protein [Flavobacteriaceae bacterium]